MGYNGLISVYNLFIAVLTKLLPIMHTSIAASWVVIVHIPLWVLILYNIKHCMDRRNIYKTWKCICENNEDVIRVGIQIKELNRRDEHVHSEKIL